MAVVGRARMANTAVFFMTGAVYAAWATRIPAIQERLDLSAGELGLAILGLEGGAVAGLSAGGAVVTRTGSPASLRLGYVLYPLALVGVAMAPGLIALALALALMAAGSSIVDVAMNVQGVELERHLDRPLLSGMHAGHPAGLVAGGMAGAAAAGAGVPVLAHFVVAAAVGALVGLSATRWLVREPSRPTGSAISRPSRPLLLPGLIGFCAFLLDGAATNWSAVHLRSEWGAGPGLAATAFTAFAVALTLGRVAGDRLVARLGRRRVVEAGGVGWPRSVAHSRSPPPARRSPSWGGQSSAWASRRSPRLCSERRSWQPMPRRRWRSRPSARSGTWGRSRVPR
jgi:MFS family permease